MGKPNIIPVPVVGDQQGIIDALRKINQVLGKESVPTFNGVEISGTITLDDLTASRLVASNSGKELVSADLASWISGTSGVSVVDDGDGTITLSADASGIDHGGLTGLDGDDHAQYHNDTRAATWLEANYTDQVLKTTSSPEFAGLSLTGFNGIVTVDSGVLSASNTLNLGSSI